MSLCFLTNFIFAQDLVTDIDGNTYEYLTYGTQEWVLENAEMVTYRDGTPIPQVVSDSEWTSLTTGAWCYVDNNSANAKMYNWYAVAGIHDMDTTTPNKELAPEGWHVPTDAEWTILEDYLIVNGYNYDNTIIGSKIAKAMASTNGWNTTGTSGVPGNDPTANNATQLNFVAHGFRHGLYGNFDDFSLNANFWASDQTTIENPDHPLEYYSWVRTVKNNQINLLRYQNENKDGFSVRFIKDTETASTEEFNTNDIILYPNPTTSKWTIESSRVINTLTLFNLLGQKVLEQTANNTKVSIDASNLKTGVYMLQINNTIMKRMIKR